MKLSQFRSEKKMVFVDGKPKMQKSGLNGEVNFFSINKKMIKKINEEVVSKLTGDENEQKISYLMFPYLTDIEVDVDFEQFVKMIEDTSNEAITMLFDGIMSTIEEMYIVAEKREELSQRSKKIEEKMPNMKDIKKNELLSLYDEFEKELDSVKKDKFMDRIIELKKELSE